MQRGVDDNISAHLSDEELAEYIDNRVDDARQMEIERHLVECDECSDVLALVVKYGEKVEKKTLVMSDNEKEQKPVNNIDYKRHGMIFGGVAVALLVVFIKLPVEDDSSNFRAPATVETKSIVIKESIAKIKFSMDLKYLEGLEEFKKAEEYMAKESYDEARESYSMVLQTIETSHFDDIERDKLSIVVNYHIWLLSIEEGDQDSADEYRAILKDDIRRLWVKEKSINR